MIAPTPDRNGAREERDVSLPMAGSDASCHGDVRQRAELAADNPSLKALMEDYPLGPHEQPQGMCPAFGSLRVGLRMRRTATVLSGSACCVYGLTFTSHFYGARRTVGYVPFDSESLVTGQLFEDVKKAMHDLADPELYDAIVMTNLCIPTASGVPLDLLPKEINGVRIVGIDVPGFGVPTHAEAKDILSGAVLKRARLEAEEGPVARPRELVEDRPTVTLLGELFPADPMGIAALLEPLGLAVGATVPSREWRELYAALDCAAVAAVHPFYTRSVRQMAKAGRPVVGSGPVGVEGTTAWLEAIADAAGIDADATGAAVDRARAMVGGALERAPMSGRIQISGYEGSELLVARVLVEAGAEVPYVGTALPKTEWSAADLEWLEARGTHVQYRAALEQDIEAFKATDPDLVVGTTPVVQAAKEAGVPGLYFTNLVSARPIFGPAGAGSLGPVLMGAMQGRERLNRMKSFFEGVGTGHTAGYGWTDVPERKLTAKERHAKARAARAAKADDADAPAGDATDDGDATAPRDNQARLRTKERIAQSAKAKGSLPVVKPAAPEGDPATAEAGEAPGADAGSPGEEAAAC
jgi:chlorophyllide a reductase subunit Y